MSPAVPTTRTITLTLPPKDRGWFINFFSQRLLGKLLAVLLASFLVFLIDQELSTEIYGGEVLVTNQPLPQEASLLVLVPPDYVVFPMTSKTRLTLTGVTRQRRELPQIMQAVAQIPEGRLVQIAGRDDWLDLDLETSDIRIPGLDDVTVTVTPNVSFRVARRVIRKLSLVADLQNMPSDREVTATFQPTEIDVRGPAPYLFGPEALSQVSVPMDARKKGDLVFKALSQELRDKGITLLHGAEFSCTLRVTSKAVPPETYTIPDVPIRLTIAAKNDFEFEIASPLDSGKANVTLRGPPDVISRLKSPGAEFSKELEIVVSTAKIANDPDERAQIAAAGGWYARSVPADVVGLPPFPGLEVVSPTDVPVRIRLKP